MGGVDGKRAGGAPRVGVGALFAALLAVGPALAIASNDGLILRANGWYRGEADISDDQIACEVPTTGTAITDGAFSMGLWNSQGIPTLFFPDPHNPFGNPCGGWLQLQNNLAVTGQTLERVVLKASIPKTRSVWHLVPTRRRFPTACKALRRVTIRSGIRLHPAGSLSGASGREAPNVVFLQILPMVAPDLLECLRAQYASVPSDTLSSLSLVLRATAYAVDDIGNRHRSNLVSYTLTLRRLCGDGRIDDGERCDPAAPDTCGLGSCDQGWCKGDDSIPCGSDVDCVGSCQAAGSPSECTCSYQSLAPSTP